MTRPKAQKPKQGGGGTPTAAAAAAAGPLGNAQGQAAAKKRPGGEAGAPAAAATLGEQPEVDQLERKRMSVAEELRQVEKQASAAVLAPVLCLPRGCGHGSMQARATGHCKARGGGRRRARAWLALPRRSPLPTALSAPTDL